MTASSASRRWRSIVQERLQALALLDRAHDGIAPGFWDEQAERFTQRMAGTAAHDPLLPRVRPHVDGSTVVLDVGAGSGRFALALATDAQEVIAVDPSAQMLRLLTEQASAQEATNVRAVAGRLEDVDDVVGDVVICAHVLPVIPDADRFLARLDRVARRIVFVYMAAGNSDLRTDPLWRHFHGRPRPPAPSYLEAIDVLREIGIEPQVEVVEVPSTDRYATVADAVEDHLSLLRLEHSDDVRAELTGLLDTWLIRTQDGTLRPPVPVIAAAVLSWSPRSAPGSRPASAPASAVSPRVGDG